MTDRRLIYFGIAAVVIVLTYPFWAGLVVTGTTTQPELSLPADASACIEDTDFMTASHMVLLNQWRDDAVREGVREYVSQSGDMAGETVTISLTGTCLACHGTKDDFCIRCHDYANVSVTCWNCHLDPGGE